MNSKGKTTGSFELNFDGTKYRGVWKNRNMNLNTKTIFDDLKEYIREDGLLGFAVK